MVAAGLLASAPGAVAQPSTDDIYILALDHAGVPYLSRAWAINLGRAVCTFLDTNPHNTDVDAADVIVANNPIMSEWNAGSVAGIATAAYCPQYRPDAAPVRGGWA
ncbi:DUF732 domain-containing protein [Mycolicibacterium sarraceniae]|uniref:DUF732 domain-containing protein n=1 Tax=Mycolicibacterium sarraceniae TaxID=1534348 RepID=A0A7I7SYC9_9MYCO|nr:DUF732 domain-containing protein [Mycolicibacterium sarraceniae]BBY61640.1 hypothetical protein MSAR_47760 [Mycolicibacterium sarraceniae]